jgi:hypothetical protein
MTYLYSGLVPGEILERKVITDIRYFWEPNRSSVIPVSVWVTTNR